MGCIPNKARIVVVNSPEINKEKDSVSPHRESCKEAGSNMLNKFDFGENMENATKTEKKIEIEDRNTRNTLMKDNNNLKANTDDAMQINQELDERDINLIHYALSNHFLFKDKTDLIIKKVMEKLVLVQLKAGSVLFREGDPGNFFYIVKEGLLEFSIDGKMVSREFKKGDTFGELALIQKNKRSGTVTCKETSQIFCLDGLVFRESIQKLNQGNLKERLFFLNLIPIFAGLNNVQMHNLALSMLKCEFEEKQVIIREGDLGESLFIIKEGLVSCRKGEVEIRQLQSKDYFGESAILFGTKRSCSIVSVSKTSCFQISHALMIESLGENYKNIILKSIAKEAFQKSKYMKLLVFDNYFNKIFSLFKLQFYQNGDVVVHRNENSTHSNNSTHFNNKKIIVVIEGDLIYSEGELAASRSELFGEYYVKNMREKIKSDIISMADCIVLETDWNKIVQNIEMNIDKKKILSFLSQISHMRKIQIFRHSSDQRLIEICKNMKKEKFKTGEVIFEEGVYGDILYLIKKGKIRVYKNSKLLRELEEGNCFGEVSLLVNESRSATIIAETEVTTYTLSKDDFISFIDKNMLEFLVKKISLQDNFSTTLKDLFYVKSLGKGKFGSVSLVHNGKNLYAIKAVNRKSAEKQKILIKYFIEERNILLTLDHPFVMKLVKTLKDVDHIFYLMEYVPGIVMSKYLERRSESKLRNKFEIQFFTAILLIILEYLNNKSVCHRDIKPDNIMIDEKGYLKLIDFGTAIVIKDFTSTITGTPHYISPEVLMGKGYGFSCDFWSIGILAYEVYYNVYPFGNNATDPMDVYKEVLRKDLSFPKNYGEMSVVNFIQNLLKKKVYERVCSLDQLKITEFFEDFKWNELVDFSLTPPMIPEKTLNTDPFASKIQYTTKISQKNETQTKNEKESILSSYDEDVKEYNPNWADEF